MNTISIVTALAQTLDLQTFFEELAGLDAASQRHCALRALEQLCKPQTLSLHGSERVREAIAILRKYLA